MGKTWVSGTTRACNVTLAHSITVFGVELDVITSEAAKEPGGWIIEAVRREDDGRVSSAVSLEMDAGALVAVGVA